MTDFQREGAGPEAGYRMAGLTRLGSHDGGLRESDLATRCSETHHLILRWPA